MKVFWFSKGDKDDVPATQVFEKFPMEDAYKTTQLRTSIRLVFSYI